MRVRVAGEVHPLQLFPVPLEVLDHEVLARQLVVVGEVVEHLVVGEPHVVLWVENLLDRVRARPIEVPLSVVDAPWPAAPLEVAQEHALLMVDAPAEAKVFGRASLPRGGPT